MTRLTRVLCAAVLAAVAGLVTTSPSGAAAATTAPVTSPPAATATPSVERPRVRSGRQPCPEQHDATVTTRHGGGPAVV